MELQATEAPAAPAKASRIADELPPRSSLDVFVAAERKAGERPSVSTKNGPIPPFGPAQLVEVFTAYAAHAGERYYVDGEVTSQRGLRYSDCLVLGIPHATGARFEIGRRIGTLPRPFLLTVITMDAAQTRALQVHASNGTPIRVVVRVVAAIDDRKDEGLVVIAGLPNAVSSEPTPRRYRDEIWTGFEQIEEKADNRRSKPHPWALLVDEILI